MHFSIKDHTVLPGIKVVEIRDDRDRMLATVSQGDNDLQLHIVSPHFGSVEIPSENWLEVYIFNFKER